MKKIACLIVICVVGACQDSTKSSLHNKNLREVGGLITKEQADRWAARYEMKSTATREQSLPRISKASLQEVVDSMSEYDGIYFHHALDGDQHHILLIPYRDGRSLWSVTRVLDANSDSFPDLSTVSLWAQQYISENPDGPWSHFFGRHVFESILSSEDLDNIEIVPAINDEGLSQLLLYVSYLSTSTNGRIQAQVDVYDMSHICPPYCPDQPN